MAIQEFTVEELATEEWRDVVGYEGIYSVSNLGRVKRVQGTRRERILRPDQSAAYYRVDLSKNNRHRKESIHTLVAQSFIGARPTGNEVNHKDANKRNNRLSNLEYLSKHEHTADQWEKGQQPNFGEAVHTSRLTTEDVLTMRKERAEIGTTYRAFAMRYGISFWHVRCIIKRKAWKHI